METSARNRDDSAYRDMSASEFRKAFSEALDQAVRGRRIRITRHGRASERVVILRETDLEALEARIPSPLDDLAAEFDRMVERMQSRRARQAAADVGSVAAEDIAGAAVRGFTAGG